MWAERLYAAVMDGRVQYVQPIPAFPPPGDPPVPVPEVGGDIAELAELALGGKLLLVGVVYTRSRPSGVAWPASPPQGNRTTVVIVDTAEKKVVGSFTLTGRA